MKYSYQAPITICILEHLEHEEAARWDSLHTTKNALSSRYLHAIERAKLNCSFRYFLAEQNNQIVGATLGYFTHFPLFGPFHVLTFIGGSPVDLGFPFYFQQHAPKKEIFSLLVQAMIDESRKSHARYIALRDFWTPESIDAYGQVLKQYSFRQVPLFDDAFLPIVWHSFEEYLSALRAEYRKTIRRESRRVAAAGYRLEIIHGSVGEPLFIDMERLWRYLYDKYRDRDQLILPRGYFREVTALPESTALLLFREQRLVAFDLLLEKGELLDSTYCGIDYSLTGKDPVHRYLGYEIVRYAIEHQFKVVDFGISNEQNKLRVGCSLRSIDGYVRSLSPFLMKIGIDRLILRGYGTHATEAESTETASSSLKPTDVKGHSSQPSLSVHALSQQEQFEKEQYTPSVAIIGATLEGLAAALWLGRHKWKVHVYESDNILHAPSEVLPCELFPYLETTFGIQLPYEQAAVTIYYDGQHLETILPNLSIPERNCLFQFLTGKYVEAFLPSETILKHLQHTYCTVKPGPQTIKQALVRMIEKTPQGQVLLGSPLKSVSILNNHVRAIDSAGESIEDDIFVNCTRRFCPKPALSYTVLRFSINIIPYPIFTTPPWALIFITKEAWIVKPTNPPSLQTLPCRIIEVRRKGNTLTHLEVFWPTTYPVDKDVAWQSAIRTIEMADSQIATAVYQKQELDNKSITLLTGDDGNTEILGAQNLIHIVPDSDTFSLATDVVEQMRRSITIAQKLYSRITGQG